MKTLLQLLALTLLAFDLQAATTQLNALCCARPDGTDQTVGVQNAVNIAASAGQSLFVPPGIVYNKAALTNTETVLIEDYVTPGTKTFMGTLAVDNGGVADTNYWGPAAITQEINGLISTKNTINGQINCAAYGASPISTDNTIAIQSALSSGAHSVFLPEGTYRITFPLLMQMSEQTFFGMGPNATIIEVDLAAPGAGIVVGYGTNSLFHVNIHDIGFSFVSNAVDKTALELRDVRVSKFSDITVYQATGTGTNNIALDIHGRDDLTLQNLWLTGKRPIVIHTNANSYISLDTTHFENLQLACLDDDGACVFVDPDVYMSRVSFGGFNNWALGKYGFYWKNTNAYYRSFSLEFDGPFSTEQGSDPDGYSFYIEQGQFLQGGAGNVLEGLSFNGASFLDPTRNGIFMRGVYQANLIGTGLYSTTPRSQLNVDTSCDAIFGYGVRSQQNTNALAASLGGMVMVHASPTVLTTPLPFNFALWRTNQINFQYYDGLTVRGHGLGLGTPTVPNSGISMIYTNTATNYLEQITTRTFGNIFQTAPMVDRYWWAEDFGGGPVYKGIFDVTFPSFANNPYGSFAWSVASSNRPNSALELTNTETLFEVSGVRRAAEAKWWTTNRTIAAVPFRVRKMLELTNAYDGSFVGNQDNPMGLGFELHSYPDVTWLGGRIVTEYDVQHSWPTRMGFAVNYDVNAPPTSYDAMTNSVVIDGFNQKIYLGTNNASYVDFAGNASFKSVNSPGVFNILNYGASTNNADSGAAINSAITAAIAAGGGVVEIPEGIYSITNTVTVGSTVHIAGTSQGGYIFNRSAFTIGSVLKWTGASGGTLMLVQPATLTKPVVAPIIENLALDGNTTNAAYGLKIEACVAGVFRNLAIRSCSSSCLWGGNYANGSYSGLNFVYGCEFTDIGLENVQDGGGSGGSGDCMFLTGPETGGAGTEKDVTLCTFRQIWCYHENGQGIVLDEADNNQFYGVNIGRRGGGTGLGLEFRATAAGTRVSNNTFYGLYVNSGITSRADNTLAAQSNHIYGLSTSGTTAPTIEAGSTLYYTTGAGDQFSTSLTTSNITTSGTIVASSSGTGFGLDFNGQTSTASQVRLKNNAVGVSGRNNAGAGDVELFRINTLDEFDVKAAARFESALTAASGWNLTKTITAGGTTGDQTINKLSGSVNFAIGAQTITVTDSFVAASSVITATVATDDSTAKSVIAVAGSGSFVLKLNAAATAETRVNFRINN